jgi:hypothetical protein
VKEELPPSPVDLLPVLSWTAPRATAEAAQAQQQQ